MKRLLIVAANMAIGTFTGGCGHSESGGATGTAAGSGAGDNTATLPKITIDGQPAAFPPGTVTRISSCHEDGGVVRVDWGGSTENPAHLRSMVSFTLDTYTQPVDGQRHSLYDFVVRLDETKTDQDEDNGGDAAKDYYTGGELGNSHVTDEPAGYAVDTEVHWGPHPGSGTTWHRLTAELPCPSK